MLIRFVRQIVAMPLFILAVICEMFSKGSAARLYHHAWRIGHDEMTGLAVLSKSLPYLGPEVVRVMAMEMMGKHPSASIASYAGLLAYEAGDNAEAARLLEFAKSMEGDPQCLTELLEFQLANAMAHNQEEVYDLAMTMSERRDLSVTTKRLALVHLIWIDMWRGHFDKARQRAEFILSIEDDPQMETILEAIYARDELFEKAKVCAQRALASLKVDRFFWQTLASHAAGLVERGNAALLELEGVDPDRADHARSILLSRGDSDDS